MLLLAACAGSEEGQPQPTVATPTPLAPAAQDAAASVPKVLTKENASPSIASVVLIQDCGPGTTGTRGASSAGHVKEEKAKIKAKRARGSGPMRQPCTQSTLQMAFTAPGAKTAAVKLGTLRLKTPAGLELAQLVVRSPTIWSENGYKAWDGMLPASVDSKASYAISVPDWGVVETAVGGSSFDQMYVLEVEVTIGGETSTVTSPQFERARPLMIKT